MIVPDKKTEAYLNEPVSPKGVLRLCRAGVLPSSDFLRAAALCRSDRKWGKFILLILRFLTGLSFLTAVFKPEKDKLQSSEPAGLEPLLPKR